MSPQQTSPIAPRSPLSTAATSPGSSIPHERSRPNSSKRTSLLFCSMRKTSRNRRDPSSPPMRSPGWNGDEMLTRDDLLPTSPTPISGFASLKKHKTRARPTLPQMEASDFTSELNSTIRRRKSERGKNYNPLDPTFQQTSFRGTAPLKHTRTIHLCMNPNETSAVPDSQPPIKESPV